MLHKSGTAALRLPQSSRLPEPSGSRFFRLCHAQPRPRPQYQLAMVLKPPKRFCNVTCNAPQSLNLGKKGPGPGLHVRLPGIQLTKGHAPWHLRSRTWSCKHVMTRKKLSFEFAEAEVTGLTGFLGRGGGSSALCYWGGPHSTLL